MLVLSNLSYPAHGTYIGSIRLEGKKPQQVPIDSEIHFGASTRKYVIRERPQAKQPSTGYDKDEVTESLFGLPETETELDVSIPSFGWLAACQIFLVPLLSH